MIVMSVATKSRFVVKSTHSILLHEDANGEMKNKFLYWIPVVGIFVTLLKYEEDNGMGMGWMYYQTISLMSCIAIMTYLMV